MALLDRLREIVEHPLNRDRKASALARYVRWHVGSRLLPGAVLVPFANDTVLAVSPDEPGDLANHFLGLPDFADCALLLHLLRAGDVFADVGANMGSYTVLAAGACGAHAVTVEPVPSTFARMQRNVRVNDLEARVQAHMCGVGRANETLRFTSQYDQRNSIITDAAYSGPSIEVPVRRLDDVLAGVVPVLIKIDVEGWESEVLAGAQATLDGQGLLALIVEMNDDDKTKMTANEAAVHADLTAHGFAPFAYEPFSRTFTALASKNVNGLNTLYLRDVAAVQQRVKGRGTVPDPWVGDLRGWAAAALLMACGGVAGAQGMGTVDAGTAVVSGGLEISGQSVRLVSNANVTAREATASIALARGGAVNVCATSEFHLLRSGGDGLQFGLDRGAMEIRGAASRQDVVLTPDLRFTMLTGGALDLRMRVARDGDTCVENRGDGAPVLQVVETFGDAVYHLAPGQHVLFVHGSLRSVVDRESSGCGCPAAVPAMVAVHGNATAEVSAQQAAAVHPFPEAVSAGLTAAKPTLIADAPAADAALTFGADVAEKPAAVEGSAKVGAVPAAAAAPSVAAGPPPAPPGARDLVHVIGRFFKRIFRQHPQ